MSIRNVNGFAEKEVVIMYGITYRRRVRAWLLIMTVVGVLALLNPGFSAAQGNSKLSVVVTGYGGEIYTKTYFVGGGWGNWILQGHPPVGVIGGPAIVYRTYETYIIFVRGGDKALWYKESGGTWTWAGKPNGRDLAYDPDATSWGDSNAEVYVTASDGLVYFADFSQGGDHVWRPLGSPLGNATSGPSAYGYSDINGVHRGVYVRNQKGELRSRLFAMGRWEEDWEREITLGGYIKPDTSPDVTAWYYLHQDVFVIGGDGLLYEKSFNGTWGDWRPLSGGVIGSPGAAELGGRIDLFVHGNDNALYQEICAWTSSEVVTCQDEGGSHWDYLGGYLTSDPDADWTQL